MIETREVLAGAYARPPRVMHSHAVEVDAEGMAIRVLCHRVDVINLADRHASDPKATPTCRVCQRKLRTNK